MSLFVSSMVSQLSETGGIVRKATLFGSSSTAEYASVGSCGAWKTGDSAAGGFPKTKSSGADFAGSSDCSTDPKPTA